MSHHYEHESAPKPLTVFNFELPQPDGSVASIDFSRHGELGDLAFTVNKEYYTSYWTSENRIFIGLLQRMSAAKNVVESAEYIAQAKKELIDAGYTATTKGQGKMDAWMLGQLAEANNKRLQTYPMFSGGDATLIVDSTKQGGVRIAYDRAWDDERRCGEVFIPDDELWRFAAGMMARSYSDRGQDYSQLTRYPTSQYDHALAAWLASIEE